MATKRKRPTKKVSNNSMNITMPETELLKLLETAYEEGWYGSKDMGLLVAQKLIKDKHNAKADLIAGLSRGLITEADGYWQNEPDGAPQSRTGNTMLHNYGIDVASGNDLTHAEFPDPPDSSEFPNPDPDLDSSPDAPDVAENQGFTEGELFTVGAAARSENNYSLDLGLGRTYTPQDTHDEEPESNNLDGLARGVTIPNDPVDSDLGNNPILGLADLNAPGVEPIMGDGIVIDYAGVSDFVEISGNHFINTQGVVYNPPIVNLEPASAENDDDVWDDDEDDDDGWDDDEDDEDDEDD